MNTMYFVHIHPHSSLPTQLYPELSEAAVSDPEDNISQNSSIPTTSTYFCLPFHNVPCALPGDEEVAPDAPVRTEPSTVSYSQNID